MAEAAIFGTATRIVSDPQVMEYLGRLKGVGRMVVQTWQRKMTAIDALLSDALEKQVTNRAVKDWFEDLRDLAYDIEDLVDRVNTRRLKESIERSKVKLIARSVIKPKSNFKLNSAINKISRRLDDITTRAQQFGLHRVAASKKPWKIPPSTSQLDGPVIGREGAKAHIHDLLLTRESSLVVGIVGPGGSGKTTLARHAYNDAPADHFSLKGWVSVSDDFDLVRVAAAVLESVTSAPIQEFKELDSIVKKLSEVLFRQKFLIVLDDVWNTCTYNQWRELQSSFCVGAAGSKIVVTTRDVNVSKMTGDSSPFNLELMSADDCWKIFHHHALLDNRPQDAEFLKDKIVKKCSGLPLAASTLGGLLRCKKVDEWEDILNHKMWTLADQNESDILPSLKLSYHYLPPDLKRCFSYCSILPNDFEFSERQLILWWMAEGFIPQHHEHKQMEDLGSDFFQELVSRSLFQKSTRGEDGYFKRRLKSGKPVWVNPDSSTPRYIVHDMVMDLARWASGYSSSTMENMHKVGTQHIVLPKVRHSSYISDHFDGPKKFEVYYEAKRLRTFLPFSCPLSRHLAHAVTSDLLPKLQYLRLLALNEYDITELPDKIGELKLLRYLDLSDTLIRSLPDSVTTLCNLQTLLLKKCIRLKTLPMRMRNLVNLRHLDISEINRLEDMPPQLGQLTNLQTLPKFVIGKGSGSGVSEIKSLLHLQGTLHLSRLENVICVEDARSAILESKDRLEALFLEWSKRYVTMEDPAVVLGMLQPHSKLKELTIQGYGGLEFSTWIGNPSFSVMVRVKLECCYRCQSLPPFGLLPCLEELCIQEMDAVESVGFEFYGECDLPFQALKTLKFRNLKKWKKWSPSQQSDGVKVFPCLEVLSINDCPNLEGDLPEKLGSLTNLQIRGCEALVVSVSKYKQLRELQIEKCKMVVYDPNTVQSDLLERLIFSNISELGFQTETFMKTLKNVERLEVIGCEKLTHSFRNEDRLLQHLISLRRVIIEDNSSLVEKLGKEAEQLVQLQTLDCKIESLILKTCGSLLTVPKGLHHLTSVQKLCIGEFSSLVSFPDVGLPPCLRDITIYGCQSMLHFAKYRIPPSLRKIEIVRCESMKSLIEKEEEEEEVGDASCSSSCLERLYIKDCPALMCLLCKGQLPRSLKFLSILVCSQLKLITERLHDDTCQVEDIRIHSCPNLKSLPKGLCNLQTLDIHRCGSLDLWPRMYLCLRDMIFKFCGKLEIAQLRDMREASKLESLEISYIEGLTITSFPLNLTSLKILGIKNCEALLGSQGLRRLASLRILVLSGLEDQARVSFPLGEMVLSGLEDQALVSFPPGENSKETEMLLPGSLVAFTIEGFPNLRKLSKCFQLLTSLKILCINECEKLSTLPVEEGLPLSLMKLIISGCPLLEERYKGKKRSKIGHIPSVKLNRSTTGAPLFM